MPRKPYPTDLTDQQWHMIESLVPASKAGGRPRTVDRREIRERHLLHPWRAVVVGGCCLTTSHLGLQFTITSGIGV